MSDELNALPWPHAGDKLVVERHKKWIYNAWLPTQNALFAHIEGYERAAEILWKELEGRPREAGIDFLVYPLIFLYRHSVELNLKEIIREGSDLEGKPQQFPQNHLLTELWNTAKGIILRLEGKSARPHLLAMTALIEELDKLDRFSFAFRYPTTRDGSPSIPDQEWINLSVFHEAMEKMKAFFSGVRSQFDYYRSNKGY